MTVTREQMIDRVRKCFALGTSPNEHEAALAVERAHQLLLQYNLDISEVVDHPVIEVGELVTAGGPFPTWKQSLFATVGEAHYCAVFYYVLPNKNRKAVFVGRVVNREAAAAMADWLWHTVSCLSTNATAAEMGGTWRVLKAKGRLAGWENWRNSFATGVVSRLGARLRAARYADEGTVEGMALVIALDLEAKETMNELHPDMTAGRASTTKLDSWAYNQGMRAGETVTLAHGFIGEGK